MVLITVIVALILFVILTLLFDKNSGGDYEQVTFDNWHEATKEKGLFVTVVAADWCPNCQETKPVMEEVQKEYGFDYYWHESSSGTSSQAQTLSDEEQYIINAYNLEENGFSGYPYIFVTNKGEFVGSFEGRQSRDSLIENLTKLGVIE